MHIPHAAVPSGPFPGWLEEDPNDCLRTSVITLSGDLVHMNPFLKEIIFVSYKNLEKKYSNVANYLSHKHEKNLMFKYLYFDLQKITNM
jgi:hypothetical protein